jgi:hypothetical protein
MVLEFFDILVLKYRVCVLPLGPEWVCNFHKSNYRGNDVVTSKTKPVMAL